MDGGLVVFVLIVVGWVVALHRRFDETAPQPHLRRSLSAHEVIPGADDRHRVSRVSVLRTEHGAPGERRAILTLPTVVRCHNRLGRVYLLVIAPFHRRFVRSGLRRAACRGWPMLAGDHR